MAPFPRAKRFAILSIVIISVACSDGTDALEPDDGAYIPDPDTSFAIPDWTEASHGKDAEPDYTIVFPQEQVNTLEIAMKGSDWEFIQKDMKRKSGISFGKGGQGGDGIFGSDEPDYVTASLKFNGQEWYRVGFRLKGNSSLSSSWRAGIYKLPFRLDFDEFEDYYPQIKNQRFYGFNELSMSPGAKDNTLIREKAGADIFRAAGIPSSQTAFYKVYIDFGDGLKYCGVYTMVEVVDDTMIKDQFGDDDGNIYKPESTLKSFVADEFEKKNNEDENDYSDVQTFIAALNSTERTSDAAQWRVNLEASFNVDHFIKWLAVNTTMLNWDTYGTMAHNYYLYNDPGTGLTWIPWDNNEAMSDRGNNSLSLSLSGISGNWPLIRYVVDDPVYNARYKTYVKDLTENVFTAEKMNELFDHHHSLIAPYVIGPEAKEEEAYTQLSSTGSFTSALGDLKQHVVMQLQEAEEYLK
jgi:spore coat protein H